MRAFSFALLLALVGCASDETAVDAGALDAGVLDSGPPDAGFGDAGTPLADYGAPGPHPVGNVRTTMIDRTGARMLPVELWYPADESARADADTGQPMTAFESGTAHESALAGYVATAPATCIRARTRSAAAPAAASSPAMLPAVVFSHCHGCVRFDVAEIAERLASFGIVVAAPDHLEDTLWDDPLAPLDAEYLAVRASDVSSVLDRLLDATAAELPDDLRGRIDPSRVGVMGHSYGALTTGAAVTSDPRFVAAMAIAAPISLYGDVHPAEIHVPYLFLLAREDHSIGSIGNTVMRNDYASVGGTAWLIEVDDAGHFTFSDIAALHDSWSAGCGTATRMDPPYDAFTYLDNDEGRELGADVAAAFFAITLLGDPAAANDLTGLAAPAHVSMHE